MTTGTDEDFFSFVSTARVYTNGGTASNFGAARASSKDGPCRGEKEEGDIVNGSTIE